MARCASYKTVALSECRTNIPDQAVKCNRFRRHNDVPKAQKQLKLPSSFADEADREIIAAAACRAGAHCAIVLIVVAHHHAAHTNSSSFTTFTNRFPLRDAT